VQFPSGGVRIIDGQSNNGNLILGRENDEPVPAPVVPQSQTNGLNQSSFPPARALPNGEEARTRTNGSSSPLFNSNSGSFNGVVKEASSGQIVPARPVESGKASATPAVAAPAAPETRERVKSTSATKPEATLSRAEEFTAREAVARDEGSTAARASAAPNSGTAATATAPLAVPPLNTAPPVYRWYSIEASVTDDQDLAKQLQEAYSRQGLRAAVEDYWDESFGRKRYRILLGMFKTKDSAETKMAQLGDKLGPSSRIVGIE